MFPLALFDSLNIRLKLARQTVTLDSSKHYGTTTPSQVVTKEIHSVYTRDVAYKPSCFNSHEQRGPKNPYIVNTRRHTQLLQEQKHTLVLRVSSVEKTSSVASTKATCVAQP